MKVHAKRIIATLMLLLLSPALLAAGDIGIAIEKHDGESSYTVESPSQNLKATLLFPFEFSSVSLTYAFYIGSVNIVATSSHRLDDKTTTGKDYDWQHDALTVFSTSKNQLERFHRYGLSISKEITPNITLSSGFAYKQLDFSWSQTVEEDYVKDEISTHSGRSLSYEQTFYRFDAGLRYQTNLISGVRLSMEPSLIYAHATSKDSHLLRSFYTMQLAQAYGYGVNVTVEKKINVSSTVTLYGEYETYQETNTEMDYFNSLDMKYLTLPSHFSHKSSRVGVGYVYAY